MDTHHNRAVGNGRDGHQCDVVQGGMVPISSGANCNELKSLPRAVVNVVRDGRVCGGYLTFTRSVFWRNPR